MVKGRKEVDRIAASAVRREILPILRAFGFQRASDSVCEMWVGEEAARPTRYLRFHLAREGRAHDSEELGLLPELEVHHPLLTAPDVDLRRDGKGRYSPRLAEVFVARHTLTLVHGAGHPAWRGTVDTIPSLIGEMAHMVEAELVPAMQRFADPAVEAERQRERGLLTAEAVVADAKRFARMPDRRMVAWSTNAHPFGYTSADLRRAARREDRMNPDVAKLLRQSVSLHYTADHAALSGLPETEREFRALALAMERETGVELEPYG